LQRKPTTFDTWQINHHKLLTPLLLLLCGASFRYGCPKCTSSSSYCCCCCSAADLLPHQLLLLLLLQQRLRHARCQRMQDVYALLQLSHLS
jgi:hypothetical protein